MNSLLVVLGLALCGAILVLVPAVGGAAILITLIPAAVAIVLISTHRTDRTFLIQLFAAALLLRMLVGTLIYAFGWQNFFGGDAFTYDTFGLFMMKAWDGDAYHQMLVNNFTATTGSGWGMLYIVAVIYKVIGQNPLAVQFFNGVLGAATAVVSYLTVQEIFENRAVSRIAAISAGVFPSMVLWSSQGLKDGPIVFLLVLTMLATLKLGSRFTFKYLGILVMALLSLLTLRFYVFYMAVIAIGVAFLLGTKAMNAQSLLRQLAVISVLMAAFFYFGVTRYAGIQFETYGNLAMLERTRKDAAVSAESGFGADVDVSTTEGALTTIPIGLTYLMLAPFPWQMTSVRSLITLPEMLVWWCSLPILITGLWFALKVRLRKILPILVFTVLLTLSYSVFQGNVGNAYRQRAQLLIFYFIFTSVGFVLMKEKRAEKARQRESERRQLRGPRPGYAPVTAKIN